MSECACKSPPKCRFSGGQTFVICCYNYSMNEEMMISMNKQLTKIVFLLDRSGSMAGMKKSTS